MTMILDKYKPNFEMLSIDEAAHLAARMALDTTEPYTGHDLLEIAEEAGMDQADVVMTLATDSSVVGVKVVETLIGRPITRQRPGGAPPRSRGPRRSVSVKRSDPRKICYVASNPKKEGSASWARFELYRVGMTVDEFLAAGGTMGDVKWDADRDFIRFGEVPDAEE